MKQENKTNTKTEPKALVATRGRIFEGSVTKKFPTRVVIEIERTVHARKYERFFKKKTKIHARLPEGLEVSVGDYIQVQECRPLSKIIHAFVVKVLRKKGDIK